jgi:hypothetical protein
MPEAKERPILFNGPMVNAVLDGVKTVTRRALSARSLKEIGYGVQLGECHELPADGQVHPNSASYYAELCPFGLPGDRLWVRETFALLGNEDGVCIDWNDQVQKGDERRAARIYRASCSVGDYGLWQIPDQADWKPDTKDLQYEGAWRPSIHMPRWASRILLEITDVRVEQLLHITIGQICKEGLARSMYEFKPVTQAFDAFAELWNSTGGDWDANPWVWVVEFKRVEQ